MGFIIHKIGYKKGRRHDYDIYKENHPITPKEVVNVFDLGYLVGIEKDYPEQLSSIPQRKKRNPEIPTEEMEIQQKPFKKENRNRIFICQLKKYKIFADVFRNKLRRYNQISIIISCLVNYRIMNNYC